MNRFIYSFMLYLITPLILLRLMWRGLRAPAYFSRWRERFALGCKGHPVDLVIHAVSVGEVHAAMPLVNRLLADRPDLKLLVTTSTPTGSARVRALLAGKVGHVYLPYDYPGAVNRFLDCWQPRLLVIMETELWPNLIHHCARRGVKTLLANARLSEKSLIGYQNVSDLTRKLLKKLDRVTAQSVTDSERIIKLGLPADRVLVAGNLKYDMPFNPVLRDQASRDKAALGSRPVLVAASTRAAGGEVEDVKVLEAFRLLLNTSPDLLLVLVPRHPERFNEVYALIRQHGFMVARRSRDGSAGKTHQVLLGDTMGEMVYYFGLADLAFVGGSLVPTGCQNIIEPASLGLPVITGPSLFNFQAASDQLLAAGGMIVVSHTDELALAIKALLDDPDLRHTMGEAARAAVQANQGATDRNLAVIGELLAAC